MWIIKNEVRMRLERLFYCRLVQKAEADSNSNWTVPLAWLRHPCWPPKVVTKEEDVLGYLLGVLHLLVAYSNLGLGPKCEQQVRDDAIAPDRNSSRMSR
jgi:hypothetical protein